MMMKRWTAAFFCVMCVVMCVAGGLRAEGADRPNILWISVEDISARLGSYGDGYAVTPHLDRLAEQGVRYTRVFGHAGVCAVNRSGIITGMYPTSIGTQYMRCQGVPPAYVRCFTEYLRAAGYFTTNRSKTDYNFAPPRTAWDRQGNNHRDWAEREDSAQPFFSVINLTTTHESQIRAPRAETQRLVAALDDDERHDPGYAPLPPYYPDTPEVRGDMAQLYDIISGTDRTIGEILQRLEDDGLADDTIVIYWSDHGDGLPRAKRWLYDSGTAVPMIVRFPQKWEHLAPTGPGSVNGELVAFVDLGPTVLSLAGVDVPRHMQGRAFLGEGRGVEREYVYGARDRMDETYDLIRMVRDKRYKYIRNYESSRPYAQVLEYAEHMPTLTAWRREGAAGNLVWPQNIYMQPSKPLEELYDTEADPWEVNNLAASAGHGEVLERMRGELERWQLETGDMGLLPESSLWEMVKPGGEVGKTAEPTVGVVRVVNGVRYVDLSCETEGALMAWTTERGGDADWRLYTGAVPLEAGQRLRVRANRIGFEESGELVVE